jgi:hypothetical protein
MVQQGQIIELTRRTPEGNPLWAYRIRTADAIPSLSRERRVGLRR